MRWVVALALLGGCDATFRLDPLPPPSTADAADAADAAPGLSTCEADCVCDAFGGPIDAGRWATFTFAGITVAARDTLKIDMQPVANFAQGAEGGVRLLGMWNMVGGHVDVEVPHVIGGLNQLTENYIRLATDGDPANGYVIRYSSNLIQFSTRVDNVYTHHVQRSFDAIGDRFWRVASNADGTMVTFETRATATAAWNQIAVVPAMVSVANLQILLVAGTYNGGDSDPGIVEYDNFALCGASKN